MIKLDSLDKYPDIQRDLITSQSTNNRIEISKLNSSVSCFHNNTRLFNTHNALLLFEKECSPVLYVPKSDIFKRHFLPSKNTSYCPYKGEVNYWSLSVTDEIVIDAVWEYPTPSSDVAVIENHLAFANTQLAPFLQQHPKLIIHLSSETTVADLARREADIALRFTDEPPEDMVGQKVCRLPVAVYASTDSDIDSTKSLASYPWVRWSPMFAQSSVERWTDEASKGTPAVARVTTYKTLSSMIRNNAGIGCLTPWFAEDDARLKRVTPDIEAAAMDVWVLTHPDLRGVKRIKALKDLLIGMFEGKS